MRTLKIVPSPSVLNTLIAPRCISTALRVIASPRPVPPISLEWDLLQKRPQACVRVDGRLRPLRLPLKNKSQNGISYVHFIAPPAEANPGVYLEWVRAEADGAI